MRLPPRNLAFHALHCLTNPRLLEAQGRRCSLVDLSWLRYEYRPSTSRACEECSHCRILAHGDKGGIERVDNWQRYFCFIFGDDQTGDVGMLRCWQGGKGLLGESSLCWERVWCMGSARILASGLQLNTFPSEMCSSMAGCTLFRGILLPSPVGPEARGDQLLCICRHAWR